MRLGSLMRISTIGVLIAFSLTMTRAQADTHFSGKIINMYLGGSVGGGVDTFTRTFLNHYKKYLPGNPTIVIRNMRGAGGMQAVAYSYATGKKDGTAMTTMPAGPIQAAAFYDRKLEYDIRAFKWIGSLARGESMCFTWHTSKFKSLADMRARQMTISATGARSNSTLLPLMVNHTADTRMRPIAGYGGANSVMAVEQGEVDGRCLTWSSLKANHPQWISENKVRILLDVSLRANPELPKGTPWIMDIIDDEADKEVMRLFLTPGDITVPLAVMPGTPDDIVALHRSAFEKAIKDKAYLHDAKRRNQALSPRNGEEVAGMIESLFTARPEYIQKVKDYLASPADIGKCQGDNCRKKKKK